MIYYLFLVLPEHFVLRREWSANVVEWAVIHLLRGQDLLLLLLQQQCWNALGVVLRAQHEIPKLFAEPSRLLVEETGQLDLYSFYVGL
jgi:hypothetical protein